MKKYRKLFMSLIAVLLVSSQAQAVSIKGRAISTISDILRYARGLGNVAATDTNLELGKASVIRMNDSGQLTLRYNIGTAGNEGQEVTIDQPHAYSTTSVMRDNGLLAQPLKVKAGNHNYTPFVTSSKSLLGSTTNRWAMWFYDLYFVSVYLNDETRQVDDWNLDQWCFHSWRYGYDNYDCSGYLKDIKTGIFVDGFDGELVVAAAMEVTNDYPNDPKKYSDKKVNARLDFWAVFVNNAGYCQGTKLDSLTQTKSGFEAAPLNGILNANDNEWTSKNNLNSTTASPYMVIKTAVGDFNNDGFANEVAMLTADKKGINLCVYQIRNENNNFTIRMMSDVGRIYSYSYPDYITNWSYNGWNRMPGAEVLAGDFDGDGQTEIGVVFQGDISSGNRDSRYYGGTVGSLHTYMYKWNNSTGKFAANTYSTGGVYASRIDIEELPKQEADPIESRGYYNPTKEVQVTHKYMPWGGIQAVTADIDGDGRDEIVFAGYESELREYAKFFEYRNDRNFYDYDYWFSGNAESYARPCLGLIKIASDGKLKPLDNYVWKGDNIIYKYYWYPYDDSYENLFKNHNPFSIQEYMLAPVGQNAEVFPFADREMSLTAGPLFGQSGIGKERDDIALRSYGGKLIFFKSSGSTLNYAANVDAHGTSAITAADFVKEGVTLGSPVRVVNQKDRSYTAVLQGIPYHVDTIAADGKSVTPEPQNFSYTKGSKAEYSTSGSESQKNNTTFNVSNTVETIYAIDSDTTRNVIGGIKNFNNFYGAVKDIVSIIPGTSSFVKAVDGVAGPALNFLTSLSDKTETVKKGYNSELEEQNVFKSIYSDRLDVVSYVYAKQYIWRYPILAKYGTDFGTGSKTMKYLAKQDFLTFSIYDDTNSDVFGSDPSYQPTHENGNLFSYPASVANIEGYTARQKDLSNIEGVQFGMPTTIGFNKIRANEEEKTESKTVTAGTLTKAASLIDNLFGTDLAKIPSGYQGPTFTKKTTNQEKFTLTLPNADGARLLGAYRVEAQAYIAEDGALTCGFAVNNFDQYSSLFNTSSLYRQLSDPSFVLPKKFVLTDSYPLIPTFGANTERELAMEMRGVRFYAIDFNMYTTNRLLDGAKYRVEVPMYNASFKSANNVRVDLYWVNDRTEGSLANKHLIGTTYVNMTGWSNTGDNKAWAKFEFTPSGMASAEEAGKHYQLYAVIDSDNKIQEVHEKRDLAVDSGGNNEGYFEFSVENGATVNASNVVNASANDDDFEMPDITISYSGYATWKEFYDAKIASSDGPVSLDVVIVNNSKYTLPDTELKAVYFDKELWESEEEIPSAVFGHSFTMFPYETYRIRAVIDDDLADNMRKAGRDNTFCSYTMFWLDDLLEEAGIVLSGDDSPELEVLSGDSTALRDNIVYCNEAITKTFTLSSDKPVFWRLNGIAQVIDSSETNSSDVYISPVDPTEEHFAITWTPEDALTAKAEQAELTISTIPNTTPAGNYGFVIEASEDGENWTQKDFLTIDALSSSSGSNSVAGTSSSGCDAGFSVMALAGVFAVLFMRRRVK